MILDAIAQKVVEEELRGSFHAEADARFTEIIETSFGIPWHDMRDYLKTRNKGKKLPRPKHGNGANNSLR